MVSAIRKFTALKQKFLNFCGNDDALIVICTASIFLPFYLCYAAILFTFLNAMLRHKAFKTFTPPHSKWFYAFAMLTIAVGAIYRHWLGIIVFEMAVVLFLFGFYIQSMMNEKLCRDMIRVSAYGSIAAAAVAIVQKVPNSGFRSVSLFVNANYYAYICEILIIALIYAVYHYGPSPLYYAAFAANIGGIVLSGCRSAWLAIFFGAIIVMICLQKYLHLVILSSAGIFSVIVIFLAPRLFFPRFNTFSSDENLRFLIWKTAFGYIKSHPLFGQGMVSYYLISTGRPHDTHAHSLLLDTLVNFGVVGTVLIVILAVLVLRDLIRNVHVNPTCAIPLGIMAVTFVHGFTDIPFIGAQTGPMLIIVFSLAGTCGSYARRTIPDKIMSEDSSDKPSVM